jgi:hypothetical protein
MVYPAMMFAITEEDPKEIIIPTNTEIPLKASVFDPGI